MPSRHDSATHFSRHVEGWKSPCRRHPKRLALSVPRNRRCQLPGAGNRQESALPQALLPSGRHPPCGISFAIAPSKAARPALVCAPANTFGKAACDCFMRHNTCQHKRVLSKAGNRSRATVFCGYCGRFGLRLKGSSAYHVYAPLLSHTACPTTERLRYGGSHKQNRPPGRAQKL